MNVRLTIITAFLLLLAACSAEAQPVAESPSTSGDCIDTVEEGRDYFPDKISVAHADGFTVEYFDTYKIVTVTQPFPGATADDYLSYLLVQCGAPHPEGVEADKTYEVPAGDTILMSTTYITMMDDLNLLDKVVGLDSFQFVNNTTIRERIEQDELVAINFGPDVNVELALEADPDLIMTYSFGSPDTDSAPVLENSGLPTVVNGDYVETSPLGRAEWVKFIATFYNAEAEAQTVWQEIEREYNSASERAQAVGDSPTVLADVPFEGTWYVPGAQSYVAQLINDAGGDYIFTDQEGTGSLPLDFETVFDRAQGADIWINVGSFETLNALAEADERYTEFAAYNQGEVWGNNRQQTEFGNAYFESAPARPHIVLLDLIKIFHPELADDHEFVYYQELE
jgi:iron complex transport system substrate-binding protein